MEREGLTQTECVDKPPSHFRFPALPVHMDIQLSTVTLVCPVVFLLLRAHQKEV